MKIFNIEEENLDSFWTTRGISMKFSGKKVAYDNIKGLKKQGFTLSLENTIFGKTTSVICSLPILPVPFLYYTLHKFY